MLAELMPVCVGARTALGTPFMSALYETDSQT
jgi:hypothetical protein